MKRLLIAAITVALVSANPQASADDGWKGGHGNSHASGPGGQNGGGYNPGHGGHNPGNGGYNSGHGGYKPGHGGYKPGYPGYRPGYAGHRPAYAPVYGYRGGYGYKGYAPARYYYPRPYYGYRSAGYPYYPYYPKHHNNNDNDEAAYLVGGLVVGALLTNAYNKSQANNYAYTQQVVPATQVVVAPQGRRLLRDLNGNCYERSTDAAGNELRTELPPSQCNW